MSLLRCVPVYLLSLLSPNAVEPQPPQVLPFDVPGTVNEMIRLRDGSLLVGGMFRRFNGQPMTNLVKVLPQGSIDPQFDSAVTWTVETIAEGPDRKLYLGRNDQSSLISRLSPQGSPDDFHLSYVPQFNGFASPPANLAVAGDGTIYVSGNLSTLSLDGATYVAARPDGQPLHSFTAETGVTFSNIREFLLHSDGRLWLMDDHRGFGPRDLFRVLPAGTADPTFPVISGIGNTPRLAEQLDGKVLLAGTFTELRNEPRDRLARLNNDGTLDLSFNPTGLPSGTIQAIEPSTEGQVWVSLRIPGSVQQSRVVSLNSDGSLNVSVPEILLAGTVGALQELDGGRLAVSGNFTQVNDTPSRNLAIIQLPAPKKSIVFMRDHRRRVTESATEVSLTVSRRGNISGESTIRFSVDLPSHISSLVTLPSSDMVVFPAGSPIAVIPIILQMENDAPGQDRSFSVTLTDPTGVELLDHRKSTIVSVADDDSGLIGRVYESTLAPCYCFGDPVAEILSPEIDFNWGSSAPRPALPADPAIVWSGLIVPEFTTDYTFYSNADDELSLVVDGKILITRGGFGNTSKSAAIHLEAGQPYSIEVILIDINLIGGAWLAWSSELFAKQTVPQHVLRPHGRPGEPALLLPVLSENRIELNLVGRPSTFYVLESSSNLVTWTRVVSFFTDEAGFATFRRNSVGPGLYYRAFAP